MWTVIKYKKNYFQQIENSLKNNFDQSIKLYRPEIKYIKKIKNKNKSLIIPILNNYVFCYSKKFETYGTETRCKYLKGIDYFLKGYRSNQSEIINFINFCKKYENKDGSILPNFFSDLQINRGKFLNGPFSNIIIDVLERNKNFLKISFGNFKARIKIKSGSLFNPCFN